MSYEFFPRPQPDKLPMRTARDAKRALAAFKDFSWEQTAASILQNLETQLKDFTPANDREKKIWRRARAGRAVLKIALERGETAEAVVHAMSLVADLAELGMSYRHPDRMQKSKRTRKEATIVSRLRNAYEDFIEDEEGDFWEYLVFDGEHYTLEADEAVGKVYLAGTEESRRKRVVLEKIIKKFK